MKTVNAKSSPNQDIDTAIRSMMQQIDGDGIPADTKIKIINTAINWEKVKHHIEEDGDTFDPNSL